MNDFCVLAIVGNIKKKRFLSHNVVTIHNKLRNFGISKRKKKITLLVNTSLWNDVLLGVLEYFNLGT